VAAACVRPLQGGRARGAADGASSPVAHRSSPGGGSPDPAPGCSIRLSRQRPRARAPPRRASDGHSGRGLLLGPGGSPDLVPAVAPKIRPRAARSGGRRPDPDGVRGPGSGEQL
jgi:hypothetical protein